MLKLWTRREGPTRPMPGSSPEPEIAPCSQVIPQSPAVSTPVGRARDALKARPACGRRDQSPPGVPVCASLMLQPKAPLQRFERLKIRWNLSAMPASTSSTGRRELWSETKLSLFAVREKTAKLIDGRLVVSGFVCDRPRETEASKSKQKARLGPIPPNTQSLLRRAH